MIFEGVEKALEPQTFTSPKVSQNPNNSEILRHLKDLPHFRCRFKQEKPRIAYANQQLGSPLAKTKRLNVCCLPKSSKIIDSRRLPLFYPRKRRSRIFCAKLANWYCPLPAAHKSSREYCRTSRPSREP